MLELYHWEPTLHSGEPLISLAEKQLPFESRYVDLLQLQQHEPDFLRLNPTGQVPVLVHDGRTITESGLILEYLEDTFPERPLRPQSLAERYEARSWIKYVEERMAAYVCLLGWLQFTRPTLPRTTLERARHTSGRLPPERRELWQKALDAAYTPQETAFVREALAFAVAKLERALQGSAWLAGEAYSIADIALVPTVRALRAVASEIVNAQRSPRTLEWLARAEQRPGFQLALAHARTPAPDRIFAPGSEPARWG